MLIEFSVANFKSIKERQTLSLVAANNKEMADIQPFDVPPAKSNMKLLPSAAIYGANAAGKSNLLHALRTMRGIVLQSALQLQHGDPVPVKSFELDSTTRNAPTEFEVIFIAKGVRYQYGFLATSERITEEWLLAYPKNRPQQWFNREWNNKKKKHDWSWGISLTGEKESWRKSTRDNALFLSTAIQLNSKPLEPIFDWFKKTLRMVGMPGFPPHVSASLCGTKNNKEKILEYLYAADLDIDGIKVEEISLNIEEPKATENKSDNFMKALLNFNKALEKFSKEVGTKLPTTYKIQTIHRDVDGKPVVFDFDEESGGTQKFFSFAGPWIDVLENGSVLLVDELHDNLHPKLVKHLVGLFNNKKTNPNNAQLIFVTHETYLLKQEILRRDQIWFCEKDKTQATQVFPLTDFHPRKGRENLEATYLSGAYGALPYVPEMLV